MCYTTSQLAGKMTTEKIQINIKWKMAHDAHMQNPKKKSKNLN